MRRKDNVYLKRNLISDGNYVPEGTVFEIKLISRKSKAPYLCRGLSLPVILWLDSKSIICA